MVFLYKILIPIFNKEISRNELEQYGNIMEFSAHRAVIQIHRNKVSSVAGEILGKFGIDDLDINEPRLEDIIRNLFETTSIA